MISKSYLLLLLIAIGLAKFSYCFDEDIASELNSAQDDDAYQKREDDFYKYEEKRFDMRRPKKKTSKITRTTTSTNNKNKEEGPQSNDENDSDNVNLESGIVSVIFINFIQRSLMPLFIRFWFK
jgi:hypothetical protein